jgi:hypothetical protein
MTLRSSSIEDLPNALQGDEVARRIGDARPAVFLDYDGTLTPIVDRPQDAVISERMREAVSALATRCTVCLVSGRDRPVVVLKLRIKGGEAISLDNVELLSYRHELDIRNATVVRDTRFRDRTGRVTALRSRRFVSTAHWHKEAIEWTITPENWNGRVEVISALDGRVTERQRGALPGARGTAPRSRLPADLRPGGHALKVRTRQSTMYVAEAARTRVFGQGGPIAASTRWRTTSSRSSAFDAREGEPLRVEKLVAFCSSRDRAISEPLGSAGKSAGCYPDFGEALARHSSAWDELWRACDFKLPRGPHVQLLLRAHISHILQVCSRHTADHDAGVPARGLNGEVHRGHVFWDELFVYPFLNVRLLRITRELLMYRYRRLGEAPAAASRIPRGDVPVPERKRRQGGDAGRPPQPAVRAVGAGPQPQPAARQRGDLLQHLALLRGHAGPRVPARLRRRDDARDRALLAPRSPTTTRSGTAMRSTG